MKGGGMAEQTVALLRHVEVHGPRTQPELVKGLQVTTEFARRTVGNLVHMGYLAQDQTTKPVSYTLTHKARSKLKAPDQPLPHQPRTRRPALGRPESPPPRWLVTLERKAYPTPRPYRAAELQAAHRVGAMDAFALPSRFGDRLHYRDGRVTDLAGNSLLTP